MRKLLLLFNILIFMNLVACSGLSGQEKELIVENAWARPALEGNPSAVYFKIENNLNEPERLISVDSQVAEFNEIHLSNMVNGTMKMEQQEFVEIEPNRMLEFKPKSYHIMLINLKQNLNVGDKFDITLTFEKSGQRVLNVEVKENE